MPLLPTQAEAAGLLGVDLGFLRGLVRGGEIMVVPVGQHECIPASELDRWVTANKR